MKYKIKHGSWEDKYLNTEMANWLKENRNRMFYLEAEHIEKGTGKKTIKLRKIDFWISEKYLQVPV